jgi:hypothetical protein
VGTPIRARKTDRLFAPRSKITFQVFDGSGNPVSTGAEAMCVIGNSAQSHANTSASITLTAGQTHAVKATKSGNLQGTGGWWTLG